MLEEIFKNQEIAQKEAPKRPQPETDKFFISILDELLLKNLEDLHAMERKIKQDVTFELELVRYFFIQRCVPLRENAFHYNPIYRNKQYVLKQ